MTKFFLFLTRKARMRASAAIAVLGLIVASSAGATPFLSAGSGMESSGLFRPCSPVGGTFTSTGAPVSSNAVCGPSQFGEGSGSATASIGNLGAEARALGFISGGMDSLARYADAVVFSGPGDDPVPVRMNLHVAGSLAATVSPIGLKGVADAIIAALINGTFVGQNELEVVGDVPTCPAIFPFVSFSGLGPCGFSYDATVQSAFILVPQDVPISFELDLEARVGVSAGTTAESLFSSTFGFIVGGPVFDLPAGFTANSPTSFIVNNRFLPAGPIAAVPEPSSMLLVTSALGLLGMLRRRRA